MLPWRLRLILYPLFGLFCLVIFTFLLFPFDSLRNRLEGEIEKGLGGGYAVSVDKVSPSLLTGMVLKNIRIQSRKSKSEAAVERARLKLSLFPLLWGSKKLKINVKSGAGKLTGSMVFRRDETVVDLKFDRFDLGVGRLLLPPNFPLVGQMKGEAALTFNAADPLKNVGKVHCEIQELRIDEGGKAGEFPIPALVLAKAGQASTIDIVVDRGNWELRSFKLAGGDLVFDADGKIFAARKLENYRLNLKGSFTPGAGVEEKIPILGIVTNQKVEGKYPFSITGRWSEPSIRIGDFKVPI